VRNGGDRREVVQVLLALTIISTVAAVSSALSALGLRPGRRRPQPPTVVIVVNDIKVLTTDHQPDRFGEGLTDPKELPEAS
jgi:hypothetical protein